MNKQFCRQYIYAKAPLLIILVCLSCTQAPKANMSIFNYADFGPDMLSYELIGNAWYQWNSQGPDEPNQTDNVKVVVYRNISLEKVKEMYPVIKEKQDYRYLEYSDALTYLKQFEEDSFWNDFPETKEVVKKTRERILRELGK